MDRATRRAVLVGAAYAVAGFLVLCFSSESRSVTDDWFLGVMLLFANVTGFAVAARFEVRLLGVAIAGLAGMSAGGWLGVQTIGSFEYTVPTPRDERVLKIVTPGMEREIELTGVPEFTVKRVPVGGGLGTLLGWSVGLGVYVRFAGRRTDSDSPDEYVMDHTPPDHGPDKAGP
ncbi:MAG: hypothetical protein ACRC7O_04360 [Fimbriiglobus sp.]